jgi:hypothetical protein
VKPTEGSPSMAEKYIAEMHQAHVEAEEKRKAEEEQQR